MNILDTRADEQRVKALELAVATPSAIGAADHSPKSVVERAKAYYDFLDGGAKDEAND